MLDTVSVAAGTTGGITEENRDSVTSCHPSCDKPTSSAMMSTTAGDNCEDNIDGLTENLCKNCCISSDGQKESVGAVDETSSEEHAEPCSSETEKDDQEKASDEEDDIKDDLRETLAGQDCVKDDLKKVSVHDEAIEDDQKEVSAEDDIGKGQKGVTEDEKVVISQQNVKDEADSDEETVKEVERNDVEKILVGGQRDGDESQESPLSMRRREGVEHECPSPTGLEAGEVTDDDEVSGGPTVVVTVTKHEGDDSDDEEVTKVAEDMKTRLRLTDFGPQSHNFIPRSPNGKPMPHEYNDTLFNLEELFDNDGQRYDGTGKRDRIDGTDMPAKYMLPLSDDDVIQNMLDEKMLDDEFASGMATLAEINGVDSPNVLSPAEQRVPSPGYYPGSTSPAYSCESVCSPSSGNAQSPWQPADPTEDMSAWLDELVDILDKDVSTVGNTGLLLQQQYQAPVQQQHVQQISVALQQASQVQLQQQQQAPVQLQQQQQAPVQLQQTPVQLRQQHQAPVQLQQTPVQLQQTPVQLRQQHQAPVQLQQTPVQLQQTPVQLRQQHQAPMQLQQQHQTPVQLQQTPVQLQQTPVQLQQTPVQLQQCVMQSPVQQQNEALPNWLPGSQQHQHQAQSPIQLQAQSPIQLQAQSPIQLQVPLPQQNQIQLQQQNQAQLQQHNQIQLQQQNQIQLQQPNQIQLQQQNQIKLEQQTQAQMQQQNQAQMQQHNQIQLQQQNQIKLEQHNQAQMQQQSQAQMQQQNQAQMQQQNQAQMQQQNQAQMQQQNQAQMQQQNQAQMQQQNQAQMQQQNQAQMQQQNQAQMQQQNQAQMQQQNQAQMQQQPQAVQQQQNQAVRQVQQQIEQLRQNVPILQRRLQFLQCEQQRVPKDKEQQFTEKLNITYREYQSLQQNIKQKQEQLQRLQAKPNTALSQRKKIKPKRVTQRYPPIQPRPPVVIVSTCQSPASPAITFIATLSPGNPTSPSSPDLSQAVSSPCMVSSPQYYQGPSSPMQHSPQPLSPQLVSVNSPQQMSPQLCSPQIQSPQPSPQPCVPTTVTQDAIIVVPGSPMQVYPPQQPSPSPQPSPQLPSPGGYSPQPSLQPSGPPFVKQEVVTTPDEAGPSECTLNINPDMRTKAERHVAAMSLEELKYIDPDDGDNLLHLAVIEKVPVMLVALISRCLRENILGSLINTVNRLNQTPLYIATVMNLPEIVAYLLSHGANPNIDARVAVNGLPPINQAALHCAARKGQAWLATLTELLKSPHVDIDKKDSDGQTPLHCAMMTHGKQSPSGLINSKDVIKLLVSHDANMNTADGKSGKTPLHYAIERKDLDLLEFVLELIPDNPAKSLNTPTYDGNCSLHIAVGLQMADIEQHKKIVRLLMRRGADASHRNNSRHLPRELVANRNQEIINILRGVSSTSRTSSQSSPLLTTPSIILAYQYQPV